MARSARKQSRKAWAQHERITRAQRPILNWARELVVDSESGLTPENPKRDVRRSIFDIVLWFSERGQPLPREMLWALAVTLRLANERGIKRSVFEKIWLAPAAEWRLVLDDRGEPVIADDDEGKPAFLAEEVEPEKRVGMRLYDRYLKSIDLEARERIRRGRPYEQAIELKNLAFDVNVTSATMMEWASTVRWNSAVSGRAAYPIGNAVQLEAIAKMRCKELSPKELAQAVNVEPSEIEAWRSDPRYQARIAALADEMRPADQMRAERMKARLDARGTGPSPK